VAGTWLTQQQNECTHARDDAPSVEHPLHVVRAHHAAATPHENQWIEFSHSHSFIVIQFSNVPQVSPVITPMKSVRSSLCRNVRGASLLLEPAVPESVVLTFVANMGETKAETTHANRRTWKFIPASSGQLQLVVEAAREISLHMALIPCDFASSADPSTLRILSAFWIVALSPCLTPFTKSLSEHELRSVPWRKDMHYYRTVMLDIAKSSISQCIGT